MRLLRSRVRVQVDGDTQVEGQVERAVEIFSRVEGEIRDFVRRDHRRLEDCSDLTPRNVDSLLQRLSGTKVPGSHLSWWRPDCVAGHVRLELRNAVAKYPFERSHRFR